MVKSVVFDCYSGISGDMAVGALLDAGASFAVLKRELAKLHVHGYSVAFRKVVKNGIKATKFDVLQKTTKKDHGHSHNKYSEIVHIISRSKLEKSVKARALSMFKRLGLAEAGVHGCSIEQVHFHEIGAVDTIVDICGAAICMEDLGIKKAFVSNLEAGGNVLIRSSHGLLPNPAPATVELLKGFRYSQSDVPHELITPTGACILAEYASRDAALSIRPGSVGYGAGGRDVEGRANALRVIVGDVQDESAAAETAVIEANIDDLAPLAFEPVMEKLFKEGALDVYFTPIQMKKNRPAVKLSVICGEEDIERLSAVIFRETTTFGVRFYRTGRLTLDREFREVRTKFGKSRVKLGYFKGELMTASPEYEDCKKLAEKKKVPFKEVYSEVKKTRSNMKS